MISFSFPHEYLLYTFYAIFYTLGAVFLVLGFTDKTNETDRMAFFMIAFIFIIVTTFSIIADLHLFEVVLT